MHVQGIPMPSLQIIEDDSLNAYARVGRKSFAIAVSRGWSTNWMIGTGSSAGP